MLGLEKIALDLTQEPVQDGRVLAAELKRTMFMVPLRQKEQARFLELLF